tara:strand:+ start:147 stop:365 length:219 start_codon:yes stop_codon:yes gene_type:complete
VNKYMESDMQIFYITICSLGCGLILALVKMAYKSKCSSIDIGCIHIKRDVDNETEYDKEHPMSDIELGNDNK